MKIQTEYQSNIDYQRTYERVTDVFPTDTNTKGILTVYIYGAVVNISPNGKVQITCSNTEEKKNVLTLLQPYLVSSSGKLWLEPYKAHFHTDWPPPSSFEFSACSSMCYCKCEDQKEKREPVTLEEIRAELKTRYEILRYKEILLKKIKAMKQQ